MGAKLDTTRPVLVTGSKHGKEYIELKLMLEDGRAIIIPMLIGTAKGIGVTLTTVADSLAAKAAPPFTIRKANLN